MSNSAAGWFVLTPNGERGPFPLERLKSFVTAGQLQPDHQIRPDGDETWRRADSVSDLFVNSTSAVRIDQLTKRFSGMQGLVGKSLQKAVAASREAIQTATAASSDIIDDIRERGGGASPPPPLPASVSESAPAASREDALIASLFEEEFASRFRGRQAISVHPAHVQKKLSGARGYAAEQPGEVILLVCDATFLGDGSEGIVVTSRGIRWKQSNGSGGRLDYSTMGSPSAVTVIGSGSKPTLRLGDQTTIDVALPGLSLDIADALAELVGRGIGIVHGTDPVAAFPLAREAIAAGDPAAAAAIWEAIWQSDPTVTSKVLGEIREATAGGAASGALEVLLQKLQKFTSDREQHWLAVHPDCPATGWSREDVRARYIAGELLADDPIRHASEHESQFASSLDWLSDIPAVFHRGPGLFEPTRFQECRTALLEQTGLESVRFFGPLETAADQSRGGIVHLAILDGQLAIAFDDGLGGPVVEVHPVESVAWAYTADEDSPSLSLVAPNRSVTSTLSDTPASGRLLAAAASLFLESAEKFLAENRRGLAQRLLGQISAAEGLGDRLEKAQAATQAIEEGLAAYRGGHPQFHDRAMGGFRIDDDGLEFTCLEPGSTTWFRIPWNKVIDVSPLQRGTAAIDLQNSFFTASNMLGMGVTIAASCIIPGGGLLARGLGQAVSGQGGQEVPMNRLIVTAAVDGTSYRIQFDVVGKNTADMNERAHAFWAKSNAMKPRFLKPGGSGGGGRPVADPEVRRLLTEIRDAVATLTQIIQFDLAGRHFVASGAVDAPALERARTAVHARVAKAHASLLAPPEDHRPQGAIVIACPTCGLKMRLNRPGIVKCPGCKTNVRLNAELFVRSLTEKA